MSLTFDILKSIHTKKDSLSLQKKRLTVDDITLLCSYLDANPLITHVNLQSCNIGPAEAKILAKNMTIASLNLSRNHIGPEGAKAFAKNSTIKSLNLRSNKIKNEGAESLAKNNSLLDLNLSYNSIGSDGIKHFKDNQSIESLVALHNRIGDMGAVSLANNTAITKLDISNNRLTLRGINPILNNKIITCLSIKNNILFSYDDKKLLEGLKKNTTLLNIDITDKNEVVEEIMKRNRQLVPRIESLNHAFLMPQAQRAEKASPGSCPLGSLPKELLGMISSFATTGNQSQYTFFMAQSKKNEIGLDKTRKDSITQIKDEFMTKNHI
jgi:Leucine rich repeat